MKKMMQSVLVAAVIMVVTGVSFSFKSETNTKGKFLIERKGKTITVKNTSDWDIDYLYISSSDNPDWGGDLLGGSPDDYLMKGETQGIIIPDCNVTWDVKIVASDGQECVIHGVNLCSAAIWEANC